MDNKTIALLMGAAGAAGEKTYVEDVFSTYLYTGNGSTQTITNGIDLAGEGGVVWIKGRTALSQTLSHVITDSEIGQGYYLDSSSTSAVNFSNGIVQQQATGFSVSSSFRVSSSGDNFVSWTFRKAPKFFDVVTYTGTGAGTTQTINHSLGSVPGLIIIKRVDDTSPWIIWHRSLTSTYYLQFSTAAANDSSNTDYFGNNVTTVEPTSTTFTVGQASSVNSGDLVAYLFAHDAGGFGDSGTESVIKCGSFTTAGGGTLSVNLGWEPQFVIYKRTDSSGNWIMLDTMRGWSQGDDYRLFANTAGVEGAANEGAPTATGFDFTDTVAGYTYIYIAIRRGPMKTPTDATEVFSSVTFNSDVFNGTKLQNACLTDWFFIANRNAGGFNTYDRLTPRSLVPSSSSAEGSVGYSFDLMDGVISTGTNYFATDLLRYHFRRAPGFFDVVAYKGTGSSSSLINHNLQAIPELVIIKNRTSTASWPVAVKINSTQYLWGFYLNSSSALTYGMFPFAFGNTDTQFAIGISSGTDIDTYRSGENYIAYLFASCPGVSKVGTYSGTGTTLDIDCGFTAGARFVLIRRVDTGGAWYVWDTARGIVSGNDPYLLLNSTAAEVTNTDYIDPLSSGFQISSTAPAAINANGGSFIFLAIA